MQFLELRNLQVSTTQEAMETYINGLPGDCLFYGQVHGNFGEYILYGLWWTGGICKCMMIDNTDIIHALRDLSGNWSFRRPQLNPM